MIRRGDLFWVDFNPAKGSEQAGRRPAVVIQNDVGNAVAPTVIVAPLTTKRFPKDYPFNVSVPQGTAGLKEPSTMLFSQIRTIDKSRLGGKIGRLPPAYLEQANRAIATSVDLSPSVFDTQGLRSYNGATRHMTQAQSEAYLSGIVPEETDAVFVAEHLSAYAFTKPFVQGKRVLEIGFGDGFGLNDLAQTAREAVGIDLAPGNIPRAQAKYPRSNVRFLHMEGTKLDFPDASFDVVGSFQVIEHIPEPQLPNYLTEIRRVLAPDGVACISTLNLEHNMKPGKPYSKLCYHEKEFTAPELLALLERFFPSVELHGLYLTPRHRIFLRLKRWGLNRLGPASLNPVAQFYQRVSVNDFRTKPSITRQAIDLYAVCRKTPAARR